MGGDFFKFLVQQSSYEMGNGPEKEKYGKSTEKCRHRIDY